MIQLTSPSPDVFHTFLQQFSLNKDSKNQTDFSLAKEAWSKNLVYSVKPPSYSI